MREECATLINSSHFLFKFIDKELDKCLVVQFGLGKLVDDEMKFPFLNGNHVPNSSLVTVVVLFFCASNFII